MESGNHCSSRARASPPKPSIPSISPAAHAASIAAFVHCAGGLTASFDCTHLCNADMIQAAAARGVDALVCDGHRLSFDQEFDAVFSNAALHWMKEDPAAVIGGAKAALKPGGRFVGELGGHGNIASIVVALSAALTFHGVELAGRHPWFFPSAEEYRTLLEAAGFEVHSMELFRRPTELPTGISGWLATFSGPWMNGLEEDKRVAVLSMAQELLEPVLKRRDDGVWVADYVRLRFSARLPAPSDT
mmetsp:Transcript_441/g.1323  ORF Transcript_441/g.1323 Transcript_441/m.1323 type:complete len:246 (+) Transcript_441:1097-1834(+)